MKLIIDYPPPQSPSLLAGRGTEGVGTRIRLRAGSRLIINNEYDIAMFLVITVYSFEGIGMSGGCLRAGNFRNAPAQRSSTSGRPCLRI